MSNRNTKIIKSYKFMLEKESKGLSFTVAELSKATGWKPATIKTYINKQWKRFVSKSGDRYSTNGLTNTSQDDFIRANSQKAKYSLTIQNEAEVLLDKSRQFALLAVYVYNNPYNDFRTYGYIVNMVIAWTSLLHAIFQKQGIEYFYKNQQGKFEHIDGEQKAWELKTCLRKYWEAESPEKRNLDFLIGLRNKIEHKKLPFLEPNVAGHCQSCINNFEAILIKEFGEKYALSSSVTLALQFSRFDKDARAKGLIALQSANYTAVIEYMDHFENSLPDRTLKNPAYRLSVFLTQKSSNHKTSADVAIEFVKADSEESDSIRTIMKDREKSKYKPKAIVEMMQQEGYTTFTMHKHTELRKDKKPRDNPKFSIRLSDGQWYYYEDWVHEVRDYCKENKL